MVSEELIQLFYFNYIWLVSKMFFPKLAGAVAAGAAGLLQSFPLFVLRNLQNDIIRKDARADSKDLDVGWANGQEMDRRLARC